VKFEKNMFRTKSEFFLNEVIFDKKRIQDLVLAASTKPIVIHTQNQHPLQVLRVAIVAKFSPLVLPAQLHDFPREYNLIIKLYDVEGNVLAIDDFRG
jgi:hypothetical protein